MSNRRRRQQEEKHELWQQKQQEFQRSKSTMVMRLTRTWDIRSPPAKVFFPRFRRDRRKRICIEIHGPEKESHDGDTDTDTDTDADVGIDDDDNKYPTRESKSKSKSTLSSRPKTIQRGLKRDSKTLADALSLSEQLLDDDRIILRILKPRKVWGLSKDPDDSSDSDTTSDDEGDENNEEEEEEVKNNNDQETTNKDDPMEVWVEYRKYGIDEIQDIEVKDKVIKAQMGLGKSLEHWTLRFESQSQAQDFWSEWTALKDLVRARSQIRLNNFHESIRRSSKQKSSTAAEAVARVVSLAKGDSTDTDDEKGVEEEETNNGPPSMAKYLSQMDVMSEMHWLLEIVSATDLPIADRIKQSTDPYTVVYAGKEEIHRTHAMGHTLNPIWTVDTGCLCLWSTTAEEFFQASVGLTFLVKDKDTIGTHKLLGKATLSHKRLLMLSGDERIPLHLHMVHRNKHVHPKSKSIFPPTLYIRARPATNDDQSFMKRMYALQRKNRTGIYADQIWVGPQQERIPLWKRESKVVDGVRKWRTKPGPDPERPEQETKWLDSNKLLEEMWKPTQRWLESGSGNLGKLYVEVLKCDNLPNMDKHQIDGKTDAFCCMVYEDSVANTDVVRDTLQPRWMPWSQRGIVFRMTHPSSQVIIGVFDYDSERRVTLNHHDPIGRIAVDVTNFHRDTEYILTYDLYRCILANEREKYGTITIRLRKVYPTFRDVLQKSLSMPPKNYMYLPRKQVFKSLYFTVHGEENLEHYSSDAISAYRAELENYLIIYQYMKKAFFHVVLWRGHKSIRIWKRTFLVPLHSIVAFVLATRLIENLDRLPAYFFFTVAWILLASNEWRQHHPSPWRGSLTFLQLWKAAILNEEPVIHIKRGENADQILAFETEMEARRKEEVEKARRATERAEKIEVFFAEERESAQAAFREDDLTTKVRGRPGINPLAIALHPIQQYLGRLCKFLRVISSVVSWDESLYAFLLTNICLVIGFIVLWIPWSFVLRWTLRLIVWVSLGPWMKLVDIFYISKFDESESPDSFNEIFEERLKTYQVGRDALLGAKEMIVKQRALKRFMFGPFVNRVPRFREYRYRDIPKSDESFAKPVPATQKDESVVIGERLHGQTLVGPMVPKWGDGLEDDINPIEDRIEIDSSKTSKSDNADEQVDDATKKNN